MTMMMQGIVAADKKWPLPQGILRLKMDSPTEASGFLLETLDGMVEIPLTDVIGERDQIILTDPQKLIELLTVANFNLTTVKEAGVPIGYMLHINPKGLAGANITVNSARLWPNARVPIVIDCKTYDEEEIRVVLRSIGEWSSKTDFKFSVYLKGYSGKKTALTDVKFIERDPPEINWVTIRRNAPSCPIPKDSKEAKESSCTTCESDIGMQGGEQFITCNLGDSYDQRSMMHEIGHALGFYHEQQRSDRRDYLSLDRKASRDNANYGLRHGDRGSYDFLSIMHYPLSSDLGKMSLTPVGLKYFRAQAPTFDCPKLSAGDIEAANFLAREGIRQFREEKEKAKSSSASSSALREIERELAKLALHSWRHEHLAELTAPAYRVPAGSSTVASASSSSSSRKPPVHKPRKDKQDWRERFKAAITLLNNPDEEAEGENQLKEIVKQLVSQEKRRRTLTRGKKGLNEEDFGVLEEARCKLEELEDARAHAYNIASDSDNDESSSSDEETKQERSGSRSPSRSRSRSLSRERETVDGSRSGEDDEARQGHYYTTGNRYVSHRPPSHGIGSHSHTASDSSIYGCGGGAGAERRGSVPRRDRW